MDIAFKFSKCKQESKCKFSMNPGAGAGVIFLEQKQK